jgi:curved DNA-binding protein CbpA
VSTPYEVLGVSTDASPDEIRRAYLRLARRHHPDFFADASATERAAAERQMQAINEAWAVLGDQQRREALDDERRASFQPFSDDDDPDPRDAPDIPYRTPAPPSSARRLTVVAPVLLFAASVGVAAAGAVIRVPALFAGAALLFILSCVGFVLIPLLALSEARRDEG